MDPPCSDYWSEDFESNAPGTRPSGWSSVTGLVSCVEHRGSIWAKLGARGSMQAWVPSAYPDRVRCKVEVMSLAPEGGGDEYFMVSLRGPVIYVAVFALAAGGFEVRVGSGGDSATVSTADPTGEVLEWEAKVVEGGVEHWLDGVLVATTAPPYDLPSQKMYPYVSAAASSTDVRVDDMSVGIYITGGSALASDRVSVSRLASRPESHSEWVHLATSFGGVPATDLASMVARCPALAVLPSGLRLRGVEVDDGVRLAVGETAFGDGVIEVADLAGHQRPALCAVGAWNEFLLLTLKDGGLYLTRGDIHDDSPRLDTGSTSAIVASAVALATPAITMLPDGSLLVCYQTESAELVQIRSTDGGATWE